MTEMYVCYEDEAPTYHQMVNTCLVVKMACNFILILDKSASMDIFTVSFRISPSKMGRR